MADNKLLRALRYFLGGVALGAVVGVLYAPKSGKETRLEVKDWLKQKREESRKLAAKFRDTIPAKKDQVVAAIRAGKEAFQDANHRKEAVAA